MTTMHFTEKMTATPEQFIAALTDCGRDTFAAGIRAVRDAEILAAFRSLRWQGGCHDDRRVR